MNKIMDKVQTEKAKKQQQKQVPIRFKIDSELRDKFYAALKVKDVTLTEYMTASVLMFLDDYEHQNQDWKLLANAPELLKALERYVNNFEEMKKLTDPDEKRHLVDNQLNHHKYVKFFIKNLKEIK